MRTAEAFRRRLERYRLLRRPRETHEHRHQPAAALTGARRHREQICASSDQLSRRGHRNPREGRPRTADVSLDGHDGALRLLLPDQRRDIPAAEVQFRREVIERDARLAK